jgi:WD40 repeat protein/serine/threonine protein kinase
VNPPGSDEALIAQLLGLSAAEQASHWHDACRHDPALRSRWPKLAREFDAVDPGAATLAPVGIARAFAAALERTNREAIGTRVGPYKLLQKIGDGGFGSVWMADQLEPLQRRVALKIIKAGMDTEEVIARFEVERQALALMDHPNIAHVFDAGATASGRPFFVMELVRGVPITRYCDENRLTAEARLHLLIPVCLAVQHAHQKGVIHRDLKPSNILVTLHDGVPVPKIIDFGIAKATDKQLTGKTLVTQFHAFVGTPVYASPEQMEMSGLDVDTRSDIYSLGVLLYELLAGRPPFDAAALVKSGLDAMRRTIREIDPPRPSHRLGTLSDADRTSVAQQRGTNVARLTLLLRGDVDWIAMHCLEKDRTRRYQTAAALAQDIEHHLRNEPVAARPPGEFYRLRKFVRRHRMGVGATMAVAVSLVSGLVASSTLFVKERLAHQRAVQAEQSESRLRQQADAARLIEARRASRTSQTLAEQLLREGRTSEGLAHLVRAARSDPQNDTVGPRLVAALAYRSFAFPAGASVAGVKAAAYDKVGTRLWTMSADGIARAWNLADGKALQSFQIEAGAVDQSPDGRHWAIGRADGSIVIRAAETAHIDVGPLHHGGNIVGVRFSPDGRWLGSAGSDRTAKLWNAATGELMAVLPHDLPLRMLAFSPAGDRVLTWTNGGKWRVWRVPHGQPLFPMQSAGVAANAGQFSPDGRTLAIADNEGAQLFDAATAEKIGPPLSHRGPTYFVAFSADGKRIVTSSDDATARIWDAVSGQPLLAPLVHGGAVRAARITPDSRLLVTQSYDGLARVWDLQSGQLALEPTRAGYVQFIDLAPDGSEFLTQSRDGVARRWRLALGAVRPLQLPNDAARLQTGLDPKTGTGIALHSDRLVKTDLLTGHEIEPARSFPASINRGSLAPGGNFACVNVRGGDWEIWDFRHREIRRASIGPLTNPRSFIFSGDLSRVAVIDGTLSVRVWNTENGALVMGQIQNASRFYCFSPDASRLVVAMPDNTAILWNLTTGSPIGSSLRHDAGILAVQFSSDGRLIATGSVDGTARLWDAETCQPVGAPLLHRSIVRGVQFTRDNRRLLTWNPLETHLWDVTSGAPLTDPMIGGNDVNGAAFSEDETRIVTWARTGSELRIWDGPRGQLLTDPLVSGQLRYAILNEFFSDGRFVASSAPGGAFLAWPVPPPSRHLPAPEWLLRLATAIAGGEIDENAVFREHAPETTTLQDIRQELARLPTDALYAEWGRWFLADRTTRPIGPGFKVTATEAPIRPAESESADMPGGVP